jgi:hypothetical protein
MLVRPRRINHDNFVGFKTTAGLGHGRACGARGVGPWNVHLKAHENPESAVTVAAKLNSDTKRRNLIAITL